jgi:tripartite-type tricarboxylate transporter receptor subunit TctC
VSLIIPSSPGGGHDNNARLVAKYAAKYAGVTINVLNQAGGGGVVGMTNIVKAKPDGLTVGQTSISAVSDQYLVAGAQYDQNSFMYIAQIAEDPNCLVIKADGIMKNMTIDQVRDYAKANPEKVRFGVSGHWTNHDFTRFQLEEVWGCKFQRVSIKGGANIVLGILAGDLEAGVPYPSEIKGNVDAGDLRILAINASSRSPLFPDIPTFTELGYAVNMPIWRAWVLPLNTPKEIFDGWAEILERTMNDPDFIKECDSVGINRSYKNSADTKKIIDESHENYKRIIEEAGLGKQ